MRVLPLLLLIVAGCNQPERSPDAQAIQGQRRASACRLEAFEGSAFTVCTAEAGRDRIELVDGRSLRSLAALEASLGQRARQVRFAMNAGMYDEDGAPIGLFVAAGEERKRLNRNRGAGNFHLLPNGVFAVDQAGRFSVTSSEAFRSRVPSPRLATQSGPMLVIDGKLHPKFDADGPSRLVRNGVGVTDGRTAFFAISEEPVSFGRFARLFRDRLNARNALYLDGTVSSLWDPATGRQDSFDRLGPMIAVFRSPPSSAE